jgi:hypothetical protein
MPVEGLPSVAQLKPLVIDAIRITGAGHRRWRSAKGSADRRRLATGG